MGDCFIVGCVHGLSEAEFVALVLGVQDCD